jgi:glycogen debranching enzyme
MADETISILEGNTFVVSDRRGDVDASHDDPQGLFHQDTRYLSRWRLTVCGGTPRLISTDDVNYFSAQFFLTPPGGNVYEDSAYSIIRKRAVGDGFHEDLTILNHTPEPLELELRIEAAADFADLFEVKDALVKKGRHHRLAESERLVLGYTRDGFVRETWVVPSAPEAVIGEDGIRFRIRVEPHGEWMTCLDVVVAVHTYGSAPRAVKYRHGDDRARPNMELGLDEWLQTAPTLCSDWRALEAIYERSLVDLAALRFYPPILPGKALPAAGLPWFMTVFGRDSLITSYQALPFVPELAETTLRVLAARQGTRVDDFRDEEPGKILHEVRFGELTAFEERPYSPYYGTADATPLFLVVLEEAVRWLGDDTLARDLEPEARAALAWIDDYGDRDGDGYLEYERRNVESGLENQCWKDSWNSIVFADGTLAELPRATCEIQGYVYDAKRRAARLAREAWNDPALADRLENEARELKKHFNEDFWLADREYFALALDGRKRPVDSLTSNIGHLLWSGIVDDDKAEAVAAHLLGERLFSGWGVRTMAAGDGAYNPVGYHTGTVWPHDNSLIALGLASYGFRDEAARISFGMLEAAEFFRYRLPEAFAGYPRSATRFPVEYPTACSPQAWASGTPLLLVRTLLGLEPDPHALHGDAHLPAGIGRLALGRPERKGHAHVAQPTHGNGAAAAIRAEKSAAGAPSAAELFGRIEDYLDPRATRGERATYRFDVVGVGSWRLEVADGRISCASGNGEADCVIRMGEATLVRVLTGEQNAFTAMLSGRLSVEGEMALAARLERFRRR